MGLFDFFKKKNTEKAKPDLISSQSALFMSISKYNEHIAYFIGMQKNENYAPIAAYEDLNGEIVGFLYAYEENESYSLSPIEVVQKMEHEFEVKLRNNNIKSYAIIYHSMFSNDGNHKPAVNNLELKAISVSYHFGNGEKGKIALPYQYENDEITYQGFSDFSFQENDTIFRTPLIQGKDYFTGREIVKAPSFENEIGLQIQKSNTKNLTNTWCGIFGFERYRAPKGSNILAEYFAFAMIQEPLIERENLKICQIEFEDIIFKAIALNGEPRTILPIVKTNVIVNVENKNIDEWENIDNLEAIVSGNGKDTFGVWYFATDYAENKNRYLTEKKLDIKISGIAFVVDTHEANYTAYIPNNDLPDYACFDFLGILEDFKESNLFENKTLKGYILKVKLITNPDVEDFFTIDMYVAKDNMRIETLTKGMKISGMFQMQGQIAV